jgi:two-component system, cell cycle sensor histidine kinase and response regulator CckA
MRSVRILVVDDDPQASALIEMALADGRFERFIDVVDTASEGLRRIKEEAHDIYLVDYRLPDGTGLDLIHEAHARGATRPFILMTGYGSEALDEAALAEGAADYVEKDLVGAYLERSIRYALRDWQTSRALQEREEQLRQAQKMEAIGRLAGGIAHDFNNLLTAIIGYTEVVTERLPSGDATARDVREIRKAADRAAGLTRQLLAFSRKQILRPIVIDLNETVTSLLQMLPRVIGEHIATVTNLGTSLRRVKADPSQIEQVLINLVLNARDAMPDGGNLTIQTSNVELTPERIESEGLHVKPGPYVMLSIADTGVGMDYETLTRAFEPFYTTKPKGKGTGLGLATVYGIVEQSGGTITVETALGRGSTFGILLPAAVRPGKGLPPIRPQAVASTGTETILLVEDNEAVRSLAKRALSQRGYSVIEARNGEEAIDSVVRGQQPHLLLTDVIMPGLSGPNLAARLTQQNPRLRVLYMSGHSDAAQAPHGALWAGVALLQKPFTPSELAERVRTVLDEPSASA